MICFISKYIKSRKKMSLSTKYKVGDISIVSYFLQACKNIPLSLSLSLSLSLIRITCPCVLNPLTPHFYIVKLGFTGVPIIFLFLL